jgi:3-methyladenine DNA glycosylase AlkD
VKTRIEPGQASLNQLKRDLAQAADPARAKFLQQYFKTDDGQYGHGDRFLGITVPSARRIALQHRALSFRDLDRLLASSVHEHRFAAVEILVARYEHAEAADRNAIARFYLEHTDRINNWDLVDGSAPYILGEYLRTRHRGLLDRLAKSDNLWERRMAIVSTLALIRHGETEDTFRIAQKLFSDEHDLIHKAVGWALRETGKVSRPALVSFLRTHQGSIPRTTLRYAIERFPPAERQRILSRKSSFVSRRNAIGPARNGRQRAVLHGA